MASCATWTRPLECSDSSCELDEEPQDQGGNYEKHQSAHSRGRSPVPCGTSRLPVAPPGFRFRVGDDRNVTRHGSASWMLSDRVWRGLVQCHIMTSGGRTARPARRVEPDNDVKLPANACSTDCRNPDRRNGGFDRSELHIESLPARAERRCSPVHTQNHRPTHLSVGAQPGGRGADDQTYSPHPRDDAVAGLCRSSTSCSVVRFARFRDIHARHM